MKKLFAVVLALFFIFTVAKAGFCEAEVSPEFKACFDKQAEAQKTARAFYKCLQAGDLDNIMNIVSVDILKKFADSNSPEGIGHNLGLALVMTSAVKDKSVSLSFGKIQMSSAEKCNGVVEVTATYSAKVTSDGKTSTEDSRDKLLLKKEEGKWVIFDFIQ
ncbi:MAG: hypothetical protein LWY06_02355 [Firmicutes bacterium]|nr:hypothetical protein [Bacillota bacterium]